MAKNISSTPTTTQPKGITARCLFTESDFRSGPGESFFRSASRVSNIANIPFSGCNPAETNQCNITDGFRPILPSQQLCQTLPGSISVPLKPHIIEAKKPSKYNPPPFIQTVSYMRDKLYEVAAVNSTQEPPELSRHISFWKEELRKESWFTDENVSIPILSV